MKRNLKSKKINELIADFVKVSQSKKPMSFKDLWRQVVGSHNASETTNIRFKDRTLFLSIKNTHLKAELLSKKNQILEEITVINSNIKELIFD